MKKSGIITAFLGIFMMIVPSKMSAQEENNGTPYYIEATMVIECKIMYAAPFDPQYFKSVVPKNMYGHIPAGVHSMYIGEVVNAWKK